MALTDLGPIFNEQGEDITDQVLEAAGQGQGNTNVSGLRRQFEQGIQETKEAKAAREAAEARALAAERELALTKSGLNLEDPMQKYFADTYQGELTVEAIKTAAATIGIIPKSEDPAVAAEMAAMARIGQAASTPTPPAGNLSYEEAIAKFEGSPEDFDAWFEREYQTEVVNSKAGAKWDTDVNTPVTTPKP